MARVVDSKLFFQSTGMSTTCMICGDCQGDGLWSGNTDVIVCSKCAVEILPKLIADSIYHEKMEMGHVDRWFKEVQNQFYRAILSQTMRKNRNG